MNQLILLAFLAFAAWLIRRDTAQRHGISRTLWIPTLWVGILTSRPLSAWLNLGGGSNTLEGSPLDRLFYLVIICISLLILAKRNVDWKHVITANWPIFLFYAYFLVSVSWADSPPSSFKRWFKDIGNVFVALLILTEKNPLQAFRTVFVRCAYLWIPLSIIFIRYFPELGRRYSRGGGLEPTGVTFQKNSLGAMVLVCGLVLLWDWFEKNRDGKEETSKLDRYLPFLLFSMGAYLLYLCDSKTSILCLLIGGVVLSAIKFPLLRNRIGSLGIYTLGASAIYFLLDSAFSLKDNVLTLLGRDATLTGRTEVWRELLALNTPPIFGTGFCSFWDNYFYQSQLPEWVAFSAHNGYLEVYIDGGWFGIAFLAILLFASALRINAHLATGSGYALIRFAVLLAILIGSYSESHFARMSELWFMFLLCAVSPSSVPQLSHEEADQMQDEQSRPFAFST